MTALNFAIIGDPQKPLGPNWLPRNKKIWQAQKNIFTALAALKPHALVLLGDVVGIGDLASHWKRFDDFSRPLNQLSVPIHMAIGNHDYGMDTPCSKRNRKHYWPEQTWRSFKYDHCTLIVLDSNANKLGKEQNMIQLAWLKSQLEFLDNDPETKFIFMFCHHPPQKKEMGSLFLDSKKTKIFFSGHRHSFESSKVGDKWFVTSGGGGPPQFGREHFYHHLELGVGENSFEMRCVAKT